MLCLSLALTSEQWAAWVQAIGSIVAIIAAAGIAIWQARAQHNSALALHATERRQELVELTRTIDVLADNCRKAVSFISAHLRDRDAVHALGEGDVHLDLDEIRRLDSALTSLPLYSLPSPLVSSVMILGSTIRQFLGKVEMAIRLHRRMDAAQFDDFFTTIRQMNESLEATCADIRREVGRAQGAT